MKEELGDLIFAVTNLARHLKADAESALENTTKKFSRDELVEILETFAEDDGYGMILRAKGIVEGNEGAWLHFDYVPGEPDVREGSAGIIGRLCVIGSGLDNEKIKELFGI